MQLDKFMRYQQAQKVRTNGGYIHYHDPGSIGGNVIISDEKKNQILETVKDVLQENADYRCCDIYTELSEEDELFGSNGVEISFKHFSRIFAEARKDLGLCEMKDVALDMISRGLNNEEIIEATGLTIGYVRVLRRKGKDKNKKSSIVIELFKKGCDRNAIIKKSKSSKSYVNHVIADYKKVIVK